MTKTEKTIRRLARDLKSGKAIKKADREILALCCEATVQMLDIKLDGLSVLPWKQAGIDRYYPPKSGQEWYGRTYTKEQIKHGIPQNAIIGDSDGYFVASVRGIDSNYEVQEDMERNRDAIVNAVNGLHKIHGMLGVNDKPPAREKLEF